MKLLHIDSSILGEASASRQLSAAIVQALTGAMPGVDVIRRDLDADPIPHLDSTLLPAVRPDIAANTAAHGAAEKGSGIVDEFLAADIVVIGGADVQFHDREPAQGLAGSYHHCRKDLRLHGGRRQRTCGRQEGDHRLISRRPLCAGNAAGSQRLPGEVLRAILGLIGIENIEIVRTEGLAFGPELREAAMRAALASVSAVVAGLFPAKAA
jgi:FMN-dependent NADH-azoreductase